MSDEDDARQERELRIRLMQTDIELKLQEIKMENRKFFVQALIGAAALLAAGMALGRFVVFHQ